MPDDHPGFLELSPETFEQVLAEHDLLVINFGASWCGPCQVFGKVFTDAAGEHRDVSFAVVDVAEQADLSRAFDVGAIPKIAVMYGGAMVFAHEGTLTDEVLRDVLRQVRELDVDAIRRAAELR